MYELRILNGLHRGAALPLDGAAVTIGTSEDADVVLADHGIADEHAVLASDGDGWLLSATGGKVYTELQRHGQDNVALAAGDCAQLGDIWLMIALQDAPWQAPPAVAVAVADAVADDQYDQYDEHDGDRHGGGGGDSVDQPERGAGADSVADAPRDGDGPAQDAAGGAAPVGGGRRLARRRKAGIVLAALAATATLLAATAYAINAGPAGSTRPVANQLASVPAGAPGGPGNAVLPASATALSAQALEKLFRKRLTDADLLNRFDLTLTPGAWSMQAQLDDEETLRFERILSAFIKEQHITFPIHAKAVTAEAMLPFKIDQIVSGPNPSVLTADGTRLYVGDDHRGVRVVAISGTRLTFFGHRKIEVLW